MVIKYFRWHKATLNKLLNQTKPMYLMMDHMMTMSLQSGDKRLSFNQKRGNVVIIFSDEKNAYYRCRSICRNDRCLSVTSRYQWDLWVQTAICGLDCKGLWNQIERRYPTYLFMYMITHRTIVYQCSKETYSQKITAVLKIQLHRILMGRLLALLQPRPQHSALCCLGNLRAGHQ